MEVLKQETLSVIQLSGFWGPMLFIFLHIIRPILFLPVIFVCLLGTIVFGSIASPIYSLIGMTLSCLIFYSMGKTFPKTFQKVAKLKDNVFGNRLQFTAFQIACLRLIPFIHFHLLTYCLYEMTVNFKEYVRMSIFTNIPFVLLYSVVGEWFLQFTYIQMAVFLIFCISLFYMFRKKEWHMSWSDFFKAEAS